ncbi:MAG: sugar phosphate isomerase/epimerase [Bacillota bacterium]|nr:sugar phosphate isomerase/epimerase [Bacillota bacterium]
MKIGISTASFFSKEATEDTFQIIEEMGIQTCEVFLTTFMEYEPEFIQQLKEKKNSVDVYSVHTLNVQFEPELFNIVKRTRDDSESIFKKIAHAAKELGASFYTFHGPTRMKRTPYHIDFARIGKRIDELDEMLYTISNGCRIAYENVHWTFFNSPEFFSTLKKYTSVRCCLDIKQAMQSKYSPYEYIDVMGDRLKNVHLCDYDSNGKLFLPGKGSVDFVKLFKYLLDKGYEGPLIMELYAKNYDSYEEILDSYEYLKNCLDKAKI